MQMDINKMMTNGIFTMNDKHTKSATDFLPLKQDRIHRH